MVDFPRQDRCDGEKILLSKDCDCPWETGFCSDTPAEAPTSAGNCHGWVHRIKQAVRGSTAGFHPARELGLGHLLLVEDAFQRFGRRPTAASGALSGGRENEI